MGSVDDDKYLEDFGPSELGTKAYWDNHYLRDLDSASDLCIPSDLESWFDDVSAPQKVAEYLTTKFPLFAKDRNRKQVALPTVLDLGCGNGSTLISLALEYAVEATMLGVDYSEPSITLAKQLWQTMREKHEAITSKVVARIDFAKFDLIHDEPTTQLWWPASESKEVSGEASGFDLVLDKGTFDAVSLSSDTAPSARGLQQKLYEIYPIKVARMVNSGGYFLITSCNWTEDEIVKHFTIGSMENVFEVFHKIKYQTYSFGGQKGQGVASVCFKKTG